MLKAVKNVLATAIVVSGLFVSTSAQALNMKISPTSPQPGDVLTITIWPHPGEMIQSASMKAFDTDQVKFYKRPNGTVRAYLGYPYDRNGGKFTLYARVQMQKAGQRKEQVISEPVAARARNFPTQRIRMNNSNAGKMSQRDALRREKELVQSKMKNSHPAPLWSGNWVVPTKGASSSAYGRKRYVNGKWWGQHSGADIRAGNGAAVVASNSGRVVLSQDLPLLRGNCIVIDHGCNVFTVYMHLSKLRVSEGATVTKGQRIGDVGATGFVTGPHLHWEMRVGWEPVDPFKIVRSGLNF